ncbi:aldo/keto reductase [Flagellimonas allohymeniacidonis]|uniref:Aldo/keto reductase n=1 Tax=Flagellimonas allohymeniacidonis TaxID=2517819 RepID=A0A4Q8Q914_9FLAO|nr:aldo/keto reductase [Allomuricauda hymeniacidonis]TAI46735.1 aldo/keto reductase [Allomuricauda hymeniacidonis]
MRYKTLGKSGLITSELTLGTMLFGESSGRATPKKEALQLVDHYLGEGGNHLDTADVYAGGISEEIIGEALKGRRDQALIATKVRFPMGENINSAGLSRWHIIKGVNDSLKRLNTDHLDLLYLHCWDPLTPLEETLRALEDLVQSGKVRYLGLSNFKAWQAMKAQGLCHQLNQNYFVAAQYQYSLVKRDIEYEFFDFMESEGLGLVPWGPLGGGFLTGKYRKEGPTDGRIASTGEDTEESWERRSTEKNWRIIDVVQELSEKHNCTPTQIAIAWILSKKVVSSVILGARTLDQLKDNLKASRIQLSAEEIQALDQTSALEELYPYRMIEAYGKRPL